MDGNLIQGIIMVVLLVMSAFFSATETSFSALNRTRLKNMAEKGNKRAEAALKLDTPKAVSQDVPSPLGNTLAPVGEAIEEDDAGAAPSGPGAAK